MTDEAEALCADCGLCCNGTLFVSVAVDEAAATRLRVRLPVVDTSEGPVLPLPCAGLEGVRCRLYPDRPDRCRTFVCELRRDLEDGRVSSDDARRLVDATRALAASVATRLPVGMAWWTALPKLERARTELAPDRLELLAAIEELARRIRTRFWQ